MKFGEMINKTRQELVISQRHEAWLEENSNPTYAQQALSFALAELERQARPRDRRGTVSASSLGSCRRRQMFTYLGMPEVHPPSKSSQILQNGTFMHLRWQMAGLTEGWLVQAEVPVGINYLNLSGTLDGVAYDDSVVEFKSINSNGFRGIATFGPKEEHIFQVGTYMATTDRDKAVVVYENKDTQEYRECVVLLTDTLRKQIEQITAIVWDYIERKELPEPLPDCELKTGWRFNSCPFRAVCLKTRDWEHAEEWSTAKG